MSDNPYAPPKARVGEPVARGLTEAPPEARLYSSLQIAAATFIGSPLIGGWLIAANHKTLARPEQANQAIILSVVVTLALIGLGIVLPERFPRVALSVAGAVGFRAWAETRFSIVLEKHRAAGGSLFSWWRVVGLALLAAAIVFTVAVTLVAVYSVVVTRE